VFQDAIDDGKVLPPAKGMDDTHTVVTDSTVDGALTAVLALLILVVIADALRVCVRHVRRPALSTLSEAPYVESKIQAPAGLIPTRAEKEEARDAGRSDGRLGPCAGTSAN
jgi:carbon starvation protein